MNNREKHLKYLIVLTMLFGACFSTAKAQPTSPCSANFEISDTCNPYYLNGEFVFLGKVISFDKRSDDPTLITVDVETPIKGNLKGKIKLLLNSGHCRGQIEENARYIFVAGGYNKDGAGWLSSGKWSEKISQKFNEKQLEELIAKIRSVTRNEKQPRIVGQVQRQFDFEVSDSYREWLKSPNIGTRSDGVLVTLPKKYNRFDTPPNYYRPFPQVTVEAKRSDGKRFTIKTDADGKYEIKELPNGEYEVRPVLTSGFTVSTYFDDLMYRIYSGHPKTSASVEIDDTICSKNVDFKVAVTGNLRVHLSNLTQNQLGSPYYPSIVVGLYKIDKSGFRDLYESYEYKVEKFTRTQTGLTITIDFIIENIPIGKYTMVVASPLYYPGVADINQADVIDIKTNATTNINYKVSSLPKN